MARTPVVVLDPGHGGHAEAGGSSPNNTSGGGLLEKDINLDVARRVRERLRGRARVLLTRDGDSNLPLVDRAGFARAMGADVFVSLHCNGHVDPSHDSTEVYVPRRASAAQRAFADALAAAVGGATGAPARAVIEADLGVLVPERHAPGTVAALVEMFDLTNPGRAQQAATGAFLDGLAAAVADAVGAQAAAASTVALGGAPAFALTDDDGTCVGAPELAAQAVRQQALDRTAPFVRAQDLDGQVADVLAHILAAARAEAGQTRSFGTNSNFVQVLRSRYLSSYLAAPSTATGEAAVELIGRQNTSGVVTDVCGAPDRWEWMTGALNNSPIPSGLADIPGMGDLPSNFGAATEILTVANRQTLDHIDGPFLLGRHTLDLLDCSSRANAALDPDLQANNGINESQLMHWATGVRFGMVGHELMRDLFLAYELWHLELWDVFGLDPINDLIVEDAGRDLAGKLLAGSITHGNLESEFDAGFRQARTWVGGLLALRQADLDRQIAAMDPPDAVIHWVGTRIGATDADHPYRSPSIRRMLADGSTVETVKSSRLVADYIAVYSLIYEAEASPPSIDTVQRLMATGSLNGVFRALAGVEAGRPVTAVISTQALGVGGRAPVRQASEDLTAALTDAEWSTVERWMSRGEVGVEPLIADAAHNALVVAEGIFCSRFLGATTSGEDPLLCVDPMVTQADPRVQQLVQHVVARGQLANWAAVAQSARQVYVMERLVDVYGYPVNGAAGLVGNLQAESQVMPNRIEGSSSAAPLRAAGFDDVVTDWTATEVMNRNYSAKLGPKLPGVGLAQWTSGGRRAGLFAHSWSGRVPGAFVLFDMDAQIDYLDTEMRTSYSGVHGVITGATVTVHDAADEVVYNFEVPGSVLDDGTKRPRTDAQVQAVFAARRAAADSALAAYRALHPE